MFNTQNYSILHDTDCKLCFVGQTKYNDMLHKYWQQHRPSVLVTLEELQQKDQQWADQHQFICAVSDVGFKYFVTEQLKKFNPHYFSVIGIGNMFSQVTIGNGTFIQNYNTAICHNISIGDHCTLGSYISLSHDTNISDYCHISAYNFLNYCNVGKGNLFAIRSTVIGDPNNQINIVPNCNFMLGSIVTKDVTTSGTYFGNRLTGAGTSIDYKLL
jgi:NDP-sugar pyrophosphorylase family protein